MKNRFFVDAPFAAGSDVELRGEEFHHAARVVRVLAGERVEVFNKAGANAAGLVTHVGSDFVRIGVGAILGSRETGLGIELALALIHPDKFELVLQKGTELGVKRFRPAITDRTETRLERVAGKVDRWRKIVLEAVKQSGRSQIPEIDTPVPFDTIVRLSPRPVLFDADQQETNLPNSSPEFTLLIGPEGGFSEREIELARSVGASFRRLGPRRLRAETAALAATVMIATLYGDLSSTDKGGALR